MRPLLLLALLAGCDPYRKWPEPSDVFPYAYTPEEGLEAWADVRWETETWNPQEDLATAGQYLLKAANHRRSAPDESLAHFDAMRDAIPPLPGEGVELAFVGDVMWVGDSWSTFLQPAAPLLADADLRVGNLETPASPEHPTSLDELPLYAFNAPPEILDGLPLDLLQLNNNHTLDVEDAGLEATLAEVDARGYARTGVDTHAVLDVEGRRIAFLSYTWGVNRPEIPTTHEIFVVPFGHIGEDIDLSGLEADVAAARADADSVVVMVHWGFEYEWYADPHFLVLGRQIVAAGADLVVGSGPHVVQPPEICSVNRPEVIPGIGACSLRTDDAEPRTAAILYSLGNFGTAMPTIPCQVGIAATAALGDGGVLGLGWEAAVTLEDAGHRVEPLDAHLDDPDLAAEAARLDAHLGAGWKR